jgi:hypothetical protein
MTWVGLGFVTAMMVTYGLVAVAASWAERPMVLWDERFGRHRSARLIRRERTGRWPTS